MDISQTSLKLALNETVKGQDKYTALLAALITKQWIKSNNPDINFGCSERCLIIGRTGNGKTFSIRQLEKILAHKFSFVFLNMSEITGSGWKGENLSEFKHKIIAAWKKQIDYILLERGLSMPLPSGDFKYIANAALKRVVIVGDEFDKIIQPLDEFTGNKAALQNDLLIFTENYEVEIKDYSVTGSLSDSLIIFLGAFDEIYKLKDAPTKHNIGFTEVDLKVKEETEDKLIELGMKRELLGRITAIIHLNELSNADLLSIIKGDIKLKGFALEAKSLGYTVMIHDDFYSSAINKVKDLKLGARSISHILNSYLLECFQELPYLDDKLVPLRDIGTLPGQQMAKERKNEQSN